jgi:CheY-like chemotaxis protein
MDRLSYKPAVALIDLVMPDRDGLEIMSAFRKVSPAMRLIAVTGAKYRGFDPLAIALKLGADAALNKPVTAEQLCAELSRLLTGGQPLAPD